MKLSKKILLSNIAISTLMLSTLLNASENKPTKEEVAKLYVATFDRGASDEEISYWTNDSFDGKATLSKIATSFFDQPETKALYPNDKSNSDFVQAIYSNLFDREPETAGLNYWVGDLDNSRVSRDKMILAIINGAKDDEETKDATTLTNKTSVVLSFANKYKTMASVNFDDAKSIMDGVNYDTSSITSALNNYDISLYKSDILQNGISYNTITSETTGKVWLDRNLGASQVCKSLNDKDCYGGYYQWGRPTDGHEKSDSSLYQPKESDSSDVSHSAFIRGDSDWTTEDNDGSKRSESWSKTDGSSVCPIGYRVPTITELEAENIINSKDAYTKLKFPSDMGRREGNGDIKTSMDGANCSAIWSVSLSENKPMRFYYDSETAMKTTGTRTNGFSVRCIKDDSVIEETKKDQPSILPLINTKDPIATTNFVVEEKPFAFDYMQGVKDGDTMHYVDEVFKSPKDVFTFNLKIPNDALYGEVAGKTIPYAGYFTFPTTNNNTNEDIKVGDYLLDNMQAVDEKFVLTESNKKYPLIIYSHGQGDQPFGSNIPTIIKRLAQNGYIVLSLAHGDNRFKSITGFDFSNLQQMTLRPLSVKTALDKLEKDAYYNTIIDFDRIGAMGSSLGGANMWMLAGAKVIGPSLFSTRDAVSDNRIKAFVGIAPLSGITFPVFGIGASGIKDVSKPMLVFSNEDDSIIPAKNIQKAMTGLNVKSNKKLIMLTNEKHVPTNAGLEIVAQWAIVFYKTYLDKDAEAKKLYDTATSSSFKKDIVIDIE